MKNLLLLFSSILFVGCSENVEQAEVFRTFTSSSTQVYADGQSTVIFSVVLNDKASADRRNVVFKTTSGVFTATGTPTATVKSEYDNGILTAKATLRVSTVPAEIKVSVKPEFDSPVGEFASEKVINSLSSIPVGLKLEASSYGLASNFLGEVKIKGLLKNSESKFVSKGYQVIFSDFLVDGSPAGGQFRDSQTVTADSSKVHIYYSARQYPVGTQIVIKSTVKDYNEITDSVILTINQ